MLNIKLKPSRACDRLYDMARVNKAKKEAIALQTQIAKHEQEETELRLLKCKNVEDEKFLIEMKEIQKKPK